MVTLKDAYVTPQTYVFLANGSAIVALLDKAFAAHKAQHVQATSLNHRTCFGLWDLLKKKLTKAYGLVSPTKIQSKKLQQFCLNWLKFRRDRLPLIGKEPIQTVAEELV